MVPSVRSIAAAQVASKAIQHQLSRATHTVEKRRRRRNMRLRAQSLPVTALGVAAMYFFDPASGSYRRTAVKRRFRNAALRKDAKVQDLRDKTDDKATQAKVAKDNTARLVTDKLHTEAPVNQ